MNSYKFGQKPNILNFFSLFYREIIKVIYAILAIAIEDFELYFRNKNPLIRKNIIQFKLYNQKYKISKYFV